jgi:amino acid adenylation domain-containing protein/thioester reductase-like protein/non-ribosomal peptide synthase protein (TIGR01720 family)
VISRFEKIVACYPANIAVKAHEQTFTYSNLNKLANQIAHWLRDNEVGPNISVAIILDNSYFSIAAMLAIIKAGGTYVPFELEQLDQIFLYLIDEVKCKVILAPLSCEDKLKQHNINVCYFDCHDQYDQYSFDNPIQLTVDSDLIYILFTSGSTGKPKAVQISHANLSHYVKGMLEILNIKSGLNFLFCSSFSADLGNTVIYLSLLTGGCLHIADAYMKRDAKLFQKYLYINKIDIIKITPSHCEALIRKQIFYNFTLKYFIFGGEKLKYTLVSWLYKNQLTHKVLNHYGPTETTIGVACYPVDTLDENMSSSQTVPIGWPIGNSSLLLIDENGNVVSGTGEGELYIGGPSVSCGYYNSAELNKQKFLLVNDIKHSGIYFVSGDYCRRTKNQALEFIDRKDRQVKIRGYRAEPQVTEAALLRQENINEAIVFPIIKDDLNFLVAVVVCTNINEFSEISLKKNLAKLITLYQIPSIIKATDILPLNANGKIDYLALKEIFNTNNVKPKVNVLQTNKFESIILSIYNKYLRTEILDLKSNFFDLGGDSILAIQAIGELQQSNIDISAQMFFENPTIYDLAYALQKHSIKVDHGISLSRKLKKELLPIQKWFFSRNFVNSQYWNQAFILESNEGFVGDILIKCIQEIIENHDIFSNSFIIKSNKIKLVNSSLLTESIITSDDISHLDKSKLAFHIQKISEKLHKEINFSSGKVIRFHLFNNAIGASKLLIVCHHLVIDGISWRILIDELSRKYYSRINGIAYSCQINKNNYWAWARDLYQFKSKFVNSYWSSISNYSYEKLPTDFNVDENTEENSSSFWLGFDKKQTDFLLKDLPSVLGVGLQEILLGLLSFSITNNFNVKRILVDVESHGREWVVSKTDISTAIGWFTALYPILLDLNNANDLNSAILKVNNVLNEVPNKGVTFDFSKDIASDIVADICFNYLGQFVLYDNGLGWKIANDFIGPARDGKSDRIYKLKFSAKIIENQLYVDLSYCNKLYNKRTIERIFICIRDSFKKIIDEQKFSYNKMNSIYHENRSCAGLLTYVPDILKDNAIYDISYNPDESVFITGATGYVGIYLLKELIDTTKHKIICLVRGEDNIQASERLKKQFKWYFPWILDEVLNQRLEIISGDVTKDELGLTSKKYKDLSKIVTTIFHCAADIRLLGNPQEFYQNNVHGTENIIKFAHSNARKKIHYISTLSVAGRSVHQNPKIFTEFDLDYQQEFLNPYEQSKFNAEKLMRQYILMGGKGYIYRMGNVSADSIFGKFQHNIASNKIYQTLKAYVVSKIAPDLPNETLVLSQVDIVVKAVVAIATANDVDSGTFHVESPHAIRHNHLVKQLISFGFDISLISPSEYLDQLVKLTESEDIEVALASIWITKAFKQPRNVIFESTWTNDLIKKWNISFPESNDIWLNKIIQHCCDVNFLSHPDKNFQSGSKELFSG